MSKSTEPEPGFQPITVDVLVDEAFEPLSHEPLVVTADEPLVVDTPDATPVAVTHRPVTAKKEQS